MNGRSKKARKGYIYKRTPDGKQIPAGDPRRGTYYLQYDLAGRRYRVCLKTSDLDKAEQERKRIMAPFLVADEKEAIGAMKQRLEATDEKLHELVEAEEEPLMLDEAWDAYIASVNRPDSGPRTLRGYRSQWNLFVQWMNRKHSKRKQLAQADFKIAQKYATYLMSEDRKTVTRKRGKRKWKEEKIVKPAFTANTYNKHIRVLELVFRVLSRRAGITVNPWSDISRKTENKQSRRELTVEELNEICNKAEGELKALLVLGIYSGLRLGDCCTLRWSEVDLVRQIILRVPNKTARRKDVPVHIPIHPTLLTFLEQTPKGRRKGHVLPGVASTYKNNDSDIAKELRKHFIACGIQIHKEGTGTGTKKRAVVEVGFHSLRHSFVSLCRQSNAPLAVVEAIVGHSNPAMTRHYTHVGELAANQAVAALPVIGQEVRHQSRCEQQTELSGRDRNMETILLRMSDQTWETDRTELLSLVRQRYRSC